MPPKLSRLSKTRYQWGLQCEKRLWLDSHHRELATSPDAGLRARLAQGHRVGELARRRWAGSVLVREAASRHERAEETTRALIADASVAAICEGAFSFRDLRVRVDVLVRDGDVFNLVEVKSSTGVKPDHISDAGVQLRVLEGAALRIGRVGLLHLDRDYCWSGGDYDLDRLFVLDDITERAREAARRVDENATALRAVLAASHEPANAVGRHCTVPYECPFRRHCWRDVDYHHICELPAVNDATLDFLAASGIGDIARIDPATVALKPADRLAHRCIVSGRPYVDHDALGEALNDLEYPISCVGVAFARPALPQFAGTAPYESLPVAWAVSSLGADGVTIRKAWVLSDCHDPRAEFFTSLAAALPERGTVAVYEPGDLDRLYSGAEIFAPQLAAGLRERATGLRSLVEANYYDGALAGSFALAPVRAAVTGGPEDRAKIDVSAVFFEWMAKDSKPARRAVLGVELAESARSGADGLAELLEGLIGLVDGAGPG
jgi:hypothetical protein